MTRTVLLYGSYGYTGSLVAEGVAAPGGRRVGDPPPMELVLAGRDPGRLAAQAARLELDYRVFDLDNPRLVAENIRDVDAVLNCAGPFAHTALPLADACLAAGVHYLDVGGEADVFAALARRHERARAAGVTLLPGAGFEVVATDCLAAHLAALLPGAVRLELAIDALPEAPAGGGVALSRGTLRSALELLLGDRRQLRDAAPSPVASPVPSATPFAGAAGVAGGRRGGREGRGGRLAPAAGRRVDFGSGPRKVLAVPWGDVETTVHTTVHTTGIADVTVYLRLPRPLRWGVALATALAPWGVPAPLKGALRRWLQARIAGRPPGPDAAARAAGRARLWGRVADAAGRGVEARLVVPEPYAFTAASALLLAARVAAGCAPRGFVTPAGAFGAKLVFEVPGAEAFEPL